MFEWLSSCNLIVQGVVITLVALIVGFNQLSYTQIILIGLLSCFIFAMIESAKLYYPDFFAEKDPPQTLFRKPTKLNHLWLAPTPKATKAGLRTIQPIHPIQPLNKRVKFNRNVETVNQWGHFSNEVLRGQTCLDD